MSFRKQTARAMPRSPRRSSRSPRRSKSASFRRRPTKRIPRRGSKGARNSRRVAGTRRYRGASQRLSEDVLNRVEKLKEEITGADRTNDSGSGSIWGQTMEHTGGDSSTSGLNTFTAPPSSFTPGTNKLLNITERVRNHTGDANQQYWNKVVDMFMALVKRGVSKDKINTFNTVPTEIMKKINDSIDEFNDKMAPPLLRRR